MARFPSLLCLFLLFGCVRAAETLPRFTDEREAAALHFVKKHLPDFLPLLEELQKNNAAQYQLQIREIFRVTEMLADLQLEPKRHDLELKIWKNENRAFLLLARLGNAKDEEKKPLEDQLRELSKELVDLDIQALEARAEDLDRELAVVKDELTRLRENPDKSVRERYETLLERVKKRRKSP